jgi:RNA polymerase sigma factor (sigma-70 family)
MDALDDMDLLREYASRQSEAAFETLVQRHINLVHSVALRQVRDSALAAEVTQTVFLILARKARTISSRTILAGWLYRTAQFTGARALRGEFRRRKHELEAAQMQPDPPDATWEQISPFLEEAMSQLGEADRNAVLLRYFEGRDLKSVGAALGANEDAARKRIGRALAKLRDFFARRGVTLSLTIMVGALSTNAVQAAPVGLVSSVTAAVSGGAILSSTTLLLKTTLKFMAWTKAKAALVMAAGALVVAGTATVTVVHVQESGSSGGVRVLPDGSFIRLLSITTGSNYTYSSVRPKPWQLNLLKRLPSSLASRFDGWLGIGGGSMSASTAGGATNVILLIARERPGARVRIPTTASTRLMVTDDDGNVFEAGSGGGTLGNDNGTIWRTIEEWILAAYPRRTKNLRLQFIERQTGGNTNRVLADFRIANPLYANYPTWTPNPLPDTQTDGNFSVTLTGLTTGSVNAPPEFGGPDEPATRAVLRCEENGRATSAWRPTSITISDATGNLWSPYSPVTPSVKDPGEIFLRGALWPGEPAFKFRVEFSRAGDFPPNETCTFRAIKIPGLAETNSPGLTADIHGVELKLVAFTGARADQPGDLRWYLNKGAPRISIRAADMPQDSRLFLARITDDRGRVVPFESERDYGLYHPNAKVFALQLPPDAKTVDCTFALSKSRFVEFVAKPEIVPAK